MSIRVDKTGRRYGKLLVLEQDHSKPKGHGVHWLCQCDCGNVVSVWSSNITERSQSKRSCGCSRGKGRTLLSGIAAFNVVYLSYKKGAVARDLLFDLSKDEFRLLTSSNCYYCGTPPSATTEVLAKHLNGHYIYNGVDRVDNNQGYKMENCVPCCFICNRAKGVFTIDEFTEWIRGLVRYYNANYLVDIQKMEAKRLIKGGK